MIQPQGLDEGISDGNDNRGAHRHGGNAQSQREADGKKSEKYPRISWREQRQDVIREALRQPGALHGKAIKENAKQNPELRTGESAQDQRSLNRNQQHERHHQDGGDAVVHHLKYPKHHGEGDDGQNTLRWTCKAVGSGKEEDRQADPGGDAQTDPFPARLGCRYLGY